MLKTSSAAIRALFRRVRRWLASVLGKIGALLTPKRRRRIWSVVTILALIFLLVSTVYTWRELPEDQRQIRSTYLGIAILIYVATYIMHLLGWQAIANLSFGRLPFRENAEAIASSDLVKILPTIAWHIARRVDYYSARQISSRSVTAASLLEMVLMMVTGGTILLFVWLTRAGNWLALLGALLAILVAAVIVGDRVRQWWSSRIAAHQAGEEGHKPLHWLSAVFWYGLSWLGGAVFLAAILQAFVPVQAEDLPALLFSWLIAGLAGYLISVTLGTIGIAREATLTLLLAQSWPLHASVATAIMVKLILTLGQVGCALLILGGLRLLRRGK